MDTGGAARDGFGDGVERIPVRIVPEADDHLGRSGRVDGSGGRHGVHGEEPVPGPVPPTEARGRVDAPRLARHALTLDDGHRVGVAVSGRGMPLVVVHGFSAEGFLYAQSLSRLVSMGFKVVAVDTAGHGGTQGLPAGGGNFQAYTALLARVVEELGIRRAVFAGHSMGGRLVTQLVAGHPDLAVALVLVDAIVGETWDRLVNAMRLFPPAVVGVGIGLALDNLVTVPVLRDPQQAAKLLRLVGPTLAGHVRRPWRLLGPGASIIRSRGSRWMLQRIAQEQVPLYVLHGDRDLVVPMRTAQDAARRGRGELVTVEGGTHSWVLRDPETLPGVVEDLLAGSLGGAHRRALADAGLDPETATVDDVEAAFQDPGSLLAELTPPLEFVASGVRRHRPRHTWTVTDHRG